MERPLLFPSRLPRRLLRDGWWLAESPAERFLPSIRSKPDSRPAKQPSATILPFAKASRP